MSLVADQEMLLPPVKPGGNEPIEPAELGTKSKRGANKAETPYWAAISRPRSRGILLVVSQTHSNDRDNRQSARSGNGER